MADCKLCNGMGFKRYPSFEMVGNQMKWVFRKVKCASCFAHAMMRRAAAS